MCPLSVPEFFRSFVDESVQAMGSQLCSHILRQSSRPQVAKLVTFAFRDFRASPWKALLADKDGCFVLMPKSQYIPMLVQHLDTLHYTCIHYEIDLAQPMHEFREASKIVGSLSEDRSLTRVLCSDLLPGNSVFCSLDCTIKTHKSAGEVVPRLLHKAPSHSWAPAMRWVAQSLRKAMCKYTHIVRDTRHLLELLANKCFAPEDRLMKVDVKDFFMSGQHEQLLDDCYEVVKKSGSSMCIFVWIMMNTILIESTLDRAWGSFLLVMFRMPLCYID